jgi:hypothetical protein
MLSSTEELYLTTGGIRQLVEFGIILTHAKYWYFGTVSSDRRFMRLYSIKS